MGELVHGLLPAGISVDTSANGIPVNFLVAGVILSAALALSFYLGLLWKARVWLGCAAIYYFLWLTLYTTVYTNWGGMFSGVWQGMGYWIAQQDVARGNQPWYYYFVGLSVSELLPLVFAILGAIFYLRKGDIFGLALVLWSRANPAGLHSRQRENALAAGRRRPAADIPGREVPGRPGGPA